MIFYWIYTMIYFWIYAMIYFWKDTMIYFWKDTMIYFWKHRSHVMLQMLSLLMQFTGELRRVVFFSKEQLSYNIYIVYIQCRWDEFWLFSFLEDFFKIFSKTLRIISYFYRHWSSVGWPDFDLISRLTWSVTHLLMWLLSVFQWNVIIITCQ